MHRRLKVKNHHFFNGLFGLPRFNGSARKVEETADNKYCVPDFQSASSLAASLRLFTLSHSQTRRLADLHFRADLCPRCAILMVLTSCDSCMSMTGNAYLYLSVGGFYGKICTRPTSCEFDLKSVTCSQMTKRTSCDLFPPKVEVADLQQVSLQIWKSGTHYSPLTRTHTKEMRLTWANKKFC